MADPRLNKISVYLIKRHVQLGEIMKKNIESFRIEIPNSGILFIREERINPPRWLRSFFPDLQLDYEKMKILSSHPSALFLIKVETKEGERVFAISFGGGWQMIDKEVIEEGFGLKTTLNLINPKGLKSIDKKSLNSVQKRSREVIGKDGVFSDFEIDIDQDLIQSVVGKTKDRCFGNILTGKDSLHLTAEIDMNNAKERLADYYSAYCREEYKSNFSWIDQVKEVTNKSLIIRLNEKIVSLINENEITEKIWFAIPDLINWEDVAGFAYGKKRETLYPDIYLNDFKALFVDEKIDLDFLKKVNVYCVSKENGNIINSFKVFKIINAEMEYEKEVYVLNNGKWYIVDKEYYVAVNEDYDEMQIYNDKMPDCPKEMNEYQYIRWMSEQGNYACMDEVKINYDNHNSIEFCDLISKNNEFIYLRRYGGSLAMNSLFRQIVTASRLFLVDYNFRKRINAKLIDDYKIKDIEKKKLDSSLYSIVIGIISSSEEEIIQIPFFSKAYARSMRKMLMAFGYDVYFKRILSLEKGIERM